MPKYAGMCVNKANRTQTHKPQYTIKCCLWDMHAAGGSAYMRVWKQQDIAVKICKIQFCFVSYTYFQLTVHIKIISSWIFCAYICLAKTFSVVKKIQFQAC